MILLESLEVLSKDEIVIESLKVPRHFLIFWDGVFLMIDSIITVTSLITTQKYMYVTGTK